LFAVALVIALALAGCGRHAATSTPPPGAVPLVVGDGRTVTLIGLGGERTDRLLTRVAAEIGPAVAAVEAFWGTDWTHDIRVVATDSAEQFLAQAGAAGRSDTAAVAVADQVDPATHRASGQRVVFAPDAVAMSDQALRIVLGHELFHYAARSATALDAPRWLTEGVADFVGRPASAPTVALTQVAVLPSDADFTGSPGQLSAAYDRAWLFARFVADRYGVPTLRRLYVHLCGPAHADVPTALREVLGAGPADVLARWRGWLALGGESPARR